jgi:hypothetical protein
LLPLHVGFCLANAVLETKHLTEPVDEITFVVSVEVVIRLLCAVRGRVVDAETGLPIETARVSVLPAGMMSEGLPVEKGGWFTVRAMQPGATDMVVRADASYDLLERDLDLVAGQQLDLGEIRLQKRPSLAGRVIDAAGRPVEAAVRAVLADWPLQGYSAIPQPVRSDAHGSFRLEGMSRLRYVLVAERPGAVGFAPIDVSSSAPSRTEIRLRPATEVTFTWVARRGSFVTKRILSQDGHALWSDAAMSRTSVLLPPGTYTIEIFNRRQPSRQTLVVGTQPQAVEVKVQ